MENETKRETIDKIAEYRAIIDSADDNLAAAFVSRMAAAKKIGELKRKLGLPVSDVARENRITDRLTDGKTPEEKRLITELYEKIFEISRREQ